MATTPVGNLEHEFAERTRNLPVDVIVRIRAGTISEAERAASSVLDAACNLLAQIAEPKPPTEQEVTVKTPPEELFYHSV